MALTHTVFDLASQAANLSAQLYAVDETVRSTAADIDGVANEISALSTVLWRLYEAMTFDPDRYTEAFKQDLEEIVKELKLVFEEISDVAGELGKQDGIHTSTVTRFLRRGKVQYLKKHLETLRTTLAVMKTVLQHGCEYKSEHSNPKLFGSDVHTLREEHTILDSVFLNNQNAIEKLHQMDADYQKARSSVDTYHHRRNSSGLSEIPEFAPLPDALSPVKIAKSPKPPKTSPGRSFSRRGVRLAVHMSILDMGAHAAPDALKDKWVQRARVQSHARKTSPVSQGASNPTEARIPLEAVHNRTRSSEIKADHHAFQHKKESDPGDQGKISHAAAEKLRRVIDQLEISPTRRAASGDHGRGGGLVSKFLSHAPLHHHKKKKDSMQELMDAFPAEVVVRRKDENEG